MVKTVKFLALSLLMPSIMLAMAPTWRDAAHFVSGSLEARAQVYCGHKAAAIQWAGANDNAVDHTLAAVKGYAGQSALSAIAVGRVHNQVVGPLINSKLLGQSAQVTLRDNTARTLGNLLVHLKGNGWSPNSSVAFASIDPFYAFALAKYVYVNRASLLSGLQADEAAVAAAYNSSTSSSTTKNKKK